MTTKQQLTVSQIRLALAGATKPIAVGYCNPLRSALKYDQCENESERGDCLGHPTPSRVYLFPTTVRVPIIVHCHPLNRKRWPKSWWGKPVCDLEIEDCPGHENGWTAATDGWEEAAVAAGASVFRTWWNRETETWWADVRLVEKHQRSSVAEAATAEQARLLALVRAVQVIEGATLMEVE